MKKKRTFERIPADLDFHCFNKDTFGSVTNVSENGMFLESKHIKFPLEMKFSVSIPLNEETLNVLVKVNRITRSNGYYDGIGVELLEIPNNYLKCINRLRFALRNRKTPSNGNS